MNLYVLQMLHFRMVGVWQKQPTNLAVLSSGMVKLKIFEDSHSVKRMNRLYHT